MAQNDIERIIWPKPGLKDLKLWEANCETVKQLCRIGTVTEWLQGEEGKDGYLNMPYHYDVDGVTVKFLPHWGYYDVAGLTLYVPRNEEQTRMAVAAVKQLVPLGYRPQST